MEALRDINLTVREGEFVAVIGRSGCGKSTMLRLIAGLVRPTAGRVDIADTLTREELTTELQRIHLQLGSTTLFVTHSIDEAVLPADRVVVLSPRPGRLRQIVDVARPRSLGRNAHLAEVARVSAELHELLLAPDEPSGRPS